VPVEDKTGLFRGIRTTCKASTCALTWLLFSGSAKRKGRRHRSSARSDSNDTVFLRDEQ
jgi:hypothetical protein